MPVTQWLPRVKERTACTAVSKTNQKPWSGLMESPWIANGQCEKHCNKGRKLQLHLSRASTLILEQIVHLCLQPTPYCREVNFRHKHTDFTDSLQELQGTCNNSNLKTQTLSTDYVSTVKKGVETNSNLKNTWYTVMSHTSLILEAVWLSIHFSIKHQPWPSQLQSLYLGGDSESFLSKDISSSHSTSFSVFILGKEVIWLVYLEPHTQCIYNMVIFVSPSKEFQSSLSPFKFLQFYYLIIL